MIKLLIKFIPAFIIVVTSCYDRFNKIQFDNPDDPDVPNVFYNGNGNTTGIVPVDLNNYSSGQSVTVLGNSDSLSRTGYIFYGWNTEANGSGTNYSPKDTFQIGNSDVMLYARWLLKWTEQLDSGIKSWNSIAQSADGMKLIATANSRYIYTSDDGGITWLKRDNLESYSILLLTSSFSSSDGVTLAVCGSEEYFFISKDSGSTWNEYTSSLAYNWESIAGSADGIKLFMCNQDGYINRSDDSGNSSSVDLSIDIFNFKSVLSITSSSNGTRLAVSGNNLVYTSADGGSSWTAHNDMEGHEYSSIASSADGTRLAVCAVNGYIYTSVDSGSIWTENTAAGKRYWQFITSSSDGTKIAACASNGYIYTSTDGGLTWIQQDHAGIRDWESITMTPDGSKIAACVNNGYIYTASWE